MFTALSIFVDHVHYGRVERPQDYINYIIDLREYDVPYHVRFAIDNGEPYTS
jgi:hypothetical protein